jgi:hypothetical protein
MSLGDILKNINVEKETAEIDLDKVSARARVYKKGQVDSAKARLESLYIEYKNEVLKRAIFIMVTGEQSEDFAGIAEDEYKCFKVDGKIFYKEIVDQLSPDLYLNKNLNAPILDVVGNVLETKMKSLDVTSYPSLAFNTKYAKVIKTKTEMVDTIKDVINDGVGGEIVGLDALERVAKEAVNKNYDKGLVPILIYSKDENFITGICDHIRLINPRIARIAAGNTESNINALATLEEVNAEQVGKALKTIAENA